MRYFATPLERPEEMEMHRFFIIISKNHQTEIFENALGIIAFSEESRVSCLSQLILIKDDVPYKPERYISVEHSNNKTTESEDEF